MLPDEDRLCLGRSVCGKNKYVFPFGSKPDLLSQRHTYFHASKKQLDKLLRTSEFVGTRPEKCTTISNRIELLSLCDRKKVNKTAGTDISEINSKPLDDKYCLGRL